MGFRTANINVPEEDLPVPEGVYSAYANYDGKKYKAAVSIGLPPTFNDAKDNVEAHILDFDKDIYSDQLELELVEYLRPMIKFESTEALIETVTNDIARIRALP